MDILKLAKMEAALKNVDLLEMPSELVLDVVGLLDKQILKTDALIAVRLYERKKEEIENGRKAIVAANCILWIMKTKNMDRKIVLEEVLNHCFLLYKNVLDGYMYPALEDTIFGNTCKEFRIATTKDGKRKNKQNAKKLPYYGIRMETQKLIGQVHELMLRTVEVIQSVKLQDSFIVPCAAITYVAFELENTQKNVLLQMAAMKVLTVIFQTYDHHRNMMMQDIFSMYIKLPTKRNGVQMCTMLIVALLQSIVPKDLHLHAEKPLRTVREYSQQILGFFVQQCTRKQESMDYKEVLIGFTNDLIEMYCQPQWPVVEIILQQLGVAMSQLVSNAMNNGTKKATENYACHVALEILGRISIAVRKNTIKIQQISWEEDSDLIQLVQEHTDFLLQRNIIVTPCTLNCLMTIANFEHQHPDAQQFLLALVLEEDIASLELVQLLRNAKYELLPESPSDIMTKRLTLKFKSQHGLGLQFDTLLAHMMILLKAGQSTFRAKVLRHVRAILEVDPLLMANEQLKSAVCYCILDEGICVRQASIDLIGKFTLLHPQTLVPKYYSTIVDRLLDSGLSVRKSVVGILRELLLHRAIYSRVCETIHHLLKRIADDSEEDSIKNHVKATIQLLWFGKPTDRVNSSVCSPKLHRKQHVQVTTSPQSDEDYDEAPKIATPSIIQRSNVLSNMADSISEAAYTIVEVVDEMKNTSPLISVLTDMFEQEQCKVKGKPAMLLGKKARLLVAHIIDIILQLEDESDDVSTLSMPSTELKLLACMKALSLFSRVSPSLLCSHIETLAPYLKSDGKASLDVEMKIAGILADIVATISQEKDFNSRVIVDMAIDFRNLIYQAPPTVVESSVKCLAAISFGQNDLDILGKTFVQFFMFLHKKRGQVESANERLSSQYQRALFCVGLIMRYYNIESNTINVHGIQPIKELGQGSIVNAVYGLYASYIALRSISDQIVTKAVQGLGSLFIYAPIILLKCQESNLLATLLDHPQYTIRLQILKCMSDLLRTETHTKMHSVAEIVKGDQEAQTSIVGSVMQAQLPLFLKLALHKQDVIRLEGLRLLGNLLVQGVVSPMQCIATVVALQTDHVLVIRTEAKRQIIDVVEKYPIIGNAAIIEGIQLSHAFQCRIFDSAIVGAPSTDELENCFFGRMYAFCLRGHRAPRETFLKGLLLLYEEMGPVMDSITKAGLKKKHIVRAIDCLCYVTKILAELPYDYDEEVLFLIYYIDRYISLKSR